MKKLFFRIFMGIVLMISLSFSHFVEACLVGSHIKNQYDFILCSEVTKKFYNQGMGYINGVIIRTNEKNDSCIWASISYHMAGSETWDIKNGYSGGGSEEAFFNKLETIVQTARKHQFNK